MKFLPAFRYFLHNWQLQMQIFWNWIHVFRNSTKPLNLFRTQGSTFITRVLNKSQSFKPLHSSWKLIHWKNIWNKSIVLPIWAVQNLTFFGKQSQVWDTNNCTCRFLVRTKKEEWILFVWPAIFANFVCLCLFVLKIKAYQFLTSHTPVSKHKFLKTKRQKKIFEYLVSFLI